MCEIAGNFATKRPLDYASLRKFLELRLSSFFSDDKSLRHPFLRPQPMTTKSVSLLNCLSNPRKMSLITFIFLFLKLNSLRRTESLVAHHRKNYLTHS